jgi:hypothetical protein
LSHKARDTVWVRDGTRRILERERRSAASLRVILGQELIKPSAVGEIIREGDVAWQVGARVESARALAAVEGAEGVLVDPVGAGGGAGEAGGDAVAGRVDAVFEVEVNFCYDAGHVDALEVADAAGFGVRDLEVGECGGVDFIFADGALAGGVLVLLDCFGGLIRGPRVLTIALLNAGRCCSCHHRPCHGQRLGRRGRWKREGQLQREWM